MTRSKTLSAAWAIALVASASFGQNLSTMTPAQAQAAAQAAQAAGQSFGSTSMTSGPTMPSNIANQGMAPGANNVMGGQYTGTADPALMGLSQNPSLVTTGQAAKTTSVTGFGGYSNAPADQGNQAAYFVTSTPIPIVKIQPTDSIAMTAAAPAVPAGIASSSSVICHTTVTNLPFDPSIDYMCNETYNQYVTSCSLDKKVIITTTPACNAAIVSSDIYPMTHPPAISCGVSPTLVVNFGTVTQQCHGGGCNSDYFEYVMTLVRGTPTRICRFLAQNYKGQWWVEMCADYDGDNTISMPPVCVASHLGKWIGQGRGEGYYEVICDRMSTGLTIISGGHYLQPNVVNTPDTDNCLSLNGLL